MYSNILKKTVIIFSVLLGILSFSKSYALSAGYDQNPYYRGQIGSHQVVVVPQQTAIDPTEQYVYVASQYHGISKYTIAGDFISEYRIVGYDTEEQMSGLSGIAVDSAGKVYALEVDELRIAVFDSDLNYEAYYDIELVPYADPTALRLFDDELYVVYEDYIEKFDLLGNPLLRIGEYGLGDGKFEFAYDLTTDSDGNIYVVDYFGDESIEKYDPNGVFLTSWVVEGLGDRAMSVVYYDSYLYVSTEDFEVEKYSLLGVFDSKWTGEYMGDSDDFLPEGYYYSIESLTIDSMGHIFITDSWRDCVEVFDIVGNYVDRFGGSDPGTYEAMKNLQILDDGSIMFTNFDDWGRLVKYSANGVFQQNIDLTYTYPIAYIHGDNIFVIYADSDILEVRELDGDMVTSWGGSGVGDGQFNRSYGIVADDNYVYVADTYNHRIQVFSHDGTFVRKFGGWGTGNTQFRYPFGIGVDSDGNIYVADRNNNCIKKFDSSGTFVTKWGVWGLGDGQFQTIEALSLYNDRIFVTDSSRNDVQVFDLSGNFISVYEPYDGDSQLVRYVRSIAVNGEYMIMGQEDYPSARLLQFQYDFTPPSGSISINSGASAINSTTLGLGINASDVLSGVNEMQISQDSGFAGATWVPYSTSESLVIPDLEGTQTVYVRFNDNDGNISLGFSDSILYDKTPPTGAIVIKSGDATISTTTAPLTISAVDNLSGVAQMMVSLDPAFAGASWEAYNTSSTIELSSGAGEKLVYIKFRDGSGNESLTYSDSITLTESEPSATINEPVITSIGTITNIPNQTSLVYYFIGIYAGISGTSDPDIIVKFNNTQTGENFQTVADSTGKWYLLLDDILPGENRYTFFATNGSGLESNLRSLKLILNQTVLPDLPIDDGDTGATTTPATSTPATTTPPTSTSTDSTSTDATSTDNATTTDQNSSSDDNHNIFDSVVSAIQEFARSVTQGLDGLLKSVPSEAVSGLSLVTIFSAYLVSLASFGFALGEIPAILIASVTNFLVAIGAKKKKNPYGYVYDSVLKEPLGNVIVRMFDRNGKLAYTDITDVYGVFRAEIPKGEYSLVTQRVGYKSPSVIITTKDDPPLGNIYTGGLVSFNGSNFVEVSIPMDSISGSLIRKLMTRSYLWLRVLLYFIAGLITLWGGILCLYMIGRNMNWFEVVMVIVYFFTVAKILKTMIVRRSKLGRITDQAGNGIADLLINIKDAEYLRYVGMAKTDSKGNYRMILAPGKYLLEFVSNDGLLNGKNDFVIDLTDKKGPTVYGEKIVIKK